jgi:hypothetical protein
MTFNGTSDYVDTNQTFAWLWSSSELTDETGTVAIWVKANDGQPASKQCFWGAYSESGMTLCLDPNGTITATMYTEDGTDSFTSAPVFSDGLQDWHFIVLTQKNNITAIEVKLYFDGQLLVSADDWSMTSGHLMTLCLGAANEIGSISHYFSGSLDDVRIYNRALTGEEVHILYDSTGLNTIKRKWLDAYFLGD